MTVVVPDGMGLRADRVVLPPAALAGQVDQAVRADPVGKGVRAERVLRAVLDDLARTATADRVVTRVDAAENAVNPWRLPFHSRR